MASSIRQVSIAQLEAYLRDNKGKALGGRRPLISVLHHTWSPTAKQYKGQSTWEGIRNYHVNERGWRDIGYHLGIGPDSSLWLLRPVTMTGAHSTGYYKGNAVNYCSIGIAMIGNYDTEDPAPIMGATIDVLAAVHRVFGLGSDDLHFHREFQNKSCPGNRIKLDVWRAALHNALAGESAPGLKLVVGDRAVDCNLRLENGTARADVRPLAEALGMTVTDHIKDQGKVYIGDNHE